MFKKICILIVLSYLAGCGKGSNLVWSRPADSKLTRLALSPDGTTLLVASREGELSLLSFADGGVSKTLQSDLKEPGYFAWSHNSEMLAVASHKGRKVGWWEKSGRLVATLSIGEARVKSRAVHHDNIQWIDTSTGEIVGSVSYVGGKQGSQVEGLAFTAAGSLISTDQKGRVQIWNREGEVSKEFAVKGRVSRAAVSPDGKTLALSGSNRLTVVDLEEEKVIIKDSASGPFQELTFSPDSSYFATSAFGKGRLFELKDKRQIGTFDSACRAIGFDQGGSLVGLAKNKEVEVWDLTTHTTVFTLKAREVRDVAVSSVPGKRLMIRRETSLKLYDLENPEELIWELKKPNKGWAVDPALTRVVVLLKDGGLECWKLPGS